MKKWKQLAFIFMLTLSLVTFSACGRNRTDNNTQDSVTNEEADKNETEDTDEIQI